MGNLKKKTKKGNKTGPSKQNLLFTGCRQCFSKKLVSKRADFQRKLGLEQVSPSRLKSEAFQDSPNVPLKKRGKKQANWTL